MICSPAVKDEILPTVGALQDLIVKFQLRCSGKTLLERGQANRCSLHQTVAWKLHRWMRDFRARRTVRFCCVGTQVMQ